MAKEPMPESKSADPEWEHIEEIRKEVEQLGVKDEAGGMRWLHNKEHETRVTAEERVTTDTLTGIPNRLGLNAAVKRILARGRDTDDNKRRIPEQGYLRFSVMMIDVDKFKTYNDTYGHDVGDKVLKEVARRFTAALRTDDVIARWAGDEFVGLFPNASAEDIKKRFQEVFEKDPITITVDTDNGPKAIPVPISAGIKEFKPGDDFDEQLKAADDALYEAKENGRNGIVVGK